MSISTTTRKAGPFNGNGVTTGFPFTFKVFAAADLLVVLTDSAGNQTTQALTTNYTVALNGDQDASPGGTVNMIVAPASGYTLTIASQVASTQTVKVTNTGGFYPDVFNNAFDKLTILQQQLAETVGRQISFPISDPTLNSQLPSAAARANTALAFDASGNVITGALSSVVVSGAMTPVVQASTLASARTAMGLGTAATFASSAFAASGANTDITSLNSPALGAATATTQASNDNTTKVATTAMVQSAVSAGSLPAATQAQQEAASSTSTTVTPGRQQYHPSAAKAWAGSSAATLQDAYNVSSITNNGTGDYTYNFTTALSTSTYAVVTSGNADRATPFTYTRATGSFRVSWLRTNDSTAQATGGSGVIVFGDFA